MSKKHTPLQTHLLIQCFGEYADRQCRENLYLRFFVREMREIFELAQSWKDAATWIAVEEISGRDVPDGARRICKEREASLFIAVDLLAGTTLCEPICPTPKGA